MAAEVPNPLAQVRIRCIQEAATKNFDLSAPETAGWLRIGVERLRMGKQITPALLREMDQSQNSKSAE